MVVVAVATEKALELIDLYTNNEEMNLIVINRLRLFCDTFVTNDIYIKLGTLIIYIISQS